PRRETPAATLPEQVDERVKAERNRDLLNIVDDSARRINERIIGSTVQVLCEGPSKTNSARLMGRTRTNKIVIFEDDSDSVGELVNIRIARATGFSLYGARSQSIRSVHRRPVECFPVNVT